MNAVPVGSPGGPFADRHPIDQPIMGHPAVPVQYLWQMRNRREPLRTAPIRSRDPTLRCLATPSGTVPVGYVRWVERRRAVGAAG